MKLLRYLHLVFICTTIIFMNGCGSSDEITSSFSSIYSKLLSTTCMSCHIPGGAATTDGANFDLTSQSTAFTTLTSNNFGGTSSSGCTSKALVVSGSSSTSGLAAVLFEDIHDTYSTASCTPYSVHHSDQNLSSKERTAIIDWINNGAQNN